jgi:AraC family transcriptional regulator, transcriptional activator FtrA
MPVATKSTPSGNKQKPRAKMQKTLVKKSPGLLAIIAYDQLRTFEYSIAAEVFTLARPSLGVAWYPHVIVAADAGTMRGIAGVQVKASAPLAVLARAQTIVIPGWRTIDKPPSLEVLNALRAAAKRGARFLSICSGAFVLGAAGLLDGRRATTHWLFADELRRQFPLAIVENDVLYVDEGNIITSAGSAAGIDACLHLVRRDFGARIANMVARRMVTAPHREGGQVQYVESPVIAQPQHNADLNLSATMEWARQHLERSISVAQMAKRSLMSGRTFLRQFHNAMGIAPLAWLQRERIAKARDLLESTDLPHSKIGEVCGYASPETFRTAFKRTVGVAPGAYRTRFAANG